MYFCCIYVAERAPYTRKYQVSFLFSFFSSHLIIRYSVFSCCTRRRPIATHIQRSQSYLDCCCYCHQMVVVGNRRTVSGFNRREPIFFRLGFVSEHKIERRRYFLFSRSFLAAPANFVRTPATSAFRANPILCAATKWKPDFYWQTVGWWTHNDLDPSFLCHLILWCVYKVYIVLARYCFANDANRLFALENVFRIIFLKQKRTHTHTTSFAFVPLHSYKRWHEINNLRSDQIFGFGLTNEQTGQTENWSEQKTENQIEADINYDWFIHINRNEKS